ncbi:hypothetical protein WAI453_000312 [Rhynchosporium graminicola]|uniref:Uncharacterized protein n=1 Tax=Rhynchosporium graminicola TaxID=2792576 RepID=A0A1E1JQ80_9HELO|nr:uncharacterized protein RCO7_00894 [Rhynchosporium commune]
MKFIATLTTAIAFVAGASAAAIVITGAPKIIYDGGRRLGTASRATVNDMPATTTLSIRDDSYWLFKTCYDPNYTGKCQMWYGFDSKCYNFGPEWENKITSIQVDIEQAHECTIFENANCGGPSENFRSRDSPDLRTSGMDDRAKSYMCKAIATVVIIPVQG